MPRPSSSRRAKRKVAQEEKEEEEEEEDYEEEAEHIEEDHAEEEYEEEEEEDDDDGVDGPRRRDADTEEEEYESEEEEKDGQRKQQQQQHHHEQSSPSQPNRRRGHGGNVRSKPQWASPGRVTEKKNKTTTTTKDSSSSSRRGRHVPLMGESSQTDTERRELRSDLRTFQQELACGDRGEKIEDPSEIEAFEEVRGRSNELWGKVAWVREAVLDADNYDLIATRAGRQADRLLQVPRYDASRFCTALRSKLSAPLPGSSSKEKYLDWHRLGVASGACYCSVPSRVYFLRGPIEAEYVVKERKKPERRRRTAEEDGDEGEERPDDVDQKRADTSGDKLSAVERNIQVVSKTLGKRCREEEASSLARAEEEIQRQADEYDDRAREKVRKRARKHGMDVDAVQYLFNPKSFTQTVENLFHFSFLVKKGSAGIGVRTAEESEKYGGAGPGPVVRATSNPEGGAPPRQAIMSLTMQDWRDLCEAYSVTECDIPHRNVSRRGGARGGGGGGGTSSSSTAAAAVSPRTP